MTDTVTASLRRLFQPGDVFEIRVLEAERVGYHRPHIEAGYFDYAHIDDVPGCLSELTGYMGVYVTMNPVNPALLARSANRLQAAKRNQTTSDADIVCRRWLLIDIDPERPGGIMATDNEKAQALDVAAAVSNYLVDRGWPEPVVVDSGNGYYLMYRIDLPADDSGLVHRVLEALTPLGTAEVKIDTSVANPARICRLPGTWNRKGDNLPERPHRQSSVLNAPAEPVVVSRELLETLAAPAKNTPPGGAVSENMRPSFTGDRPGDDFSARGNLAPILEAHGWQRIGEHDGNQHWRRPGKTQGNHSATFDGRTFYVFSSAAAPFAANTGYSPFAVYAMLNHRGDFAAASQALAAQGYGDARPVARDDSDVDLSGLLAKFAAPAEPEPEAEPGDLLPSNPGMLPPSLLAVPGLIGDIMAWTLSTAPYPNTVLSFTGALAMMSWLTGRKVKTPGGLRTNLYLIAIAESGAGKDWPRKANVRILSDLGAHNAWALEMASGEAVQDALDMTPCLLAQPDEVDTLMRSISQDTGGGPGGGRFLRLSATLMELFTSADSVYACRRLAVAATNRRKDQMPRVIDQPHLVIFSSATPEAFFASLSEQLISRGFLSRCLLLDTPERGQGQQATALDATPAHILDQARAWYEWQTSAGNLADVHPVAVAAHVRTAARVRIDACRTECDERYDSATAVAKPIWSRCAAMAEQLALIHACSACGPGTVVIDDDAAAWGVMVAEHLTKRLLWHVSRHVADGEFAKAQLKIMRRIEDGGGEATDRDIKRFMRGMKTKDLTDVLKSLVDQERIEQTFVKGARKQVLGWRRLS